MAFCDQRRTTQGIALGALGLVASSIGLLFWRWGGLLVVPVERPMPAQTLHWIVSGGLGLFGLFVLNAFWRWCWPPDARVRAHIGELPGLAAWGCGDLVILHAGAAASADGADVPSGTGRWDANHASLFQLGASLFCFCMAFASLGAVEAWAITAGMPAWRPGWLWAAYLSGFLLFNTAVHELGHALVAWALYHRVRALTIGPFVITNSGHGYSFHFEVRHLFDPSGRTGAVPRAGDRLRFEFVMTALAGPVASLLSGFLMLALLTALPGTPLQVYWWVAACNGVLGLAYAVSSLLPFGYTDGNMALHACLGTRSGGELMNRVAVTQVQESATACHRKADFEKEVALRRAALRLAVDEGGEDTLAAALCHQQLGHALLALEDWPAAEDQFRICLDAVNECAAEPELAANAWSGLLRTSYRRHHPGEVKRAYENAVPAIEAMRVNKDALGQAVCGTMLAQAHQAGGHFEMALVEAQAALDVLPSGRERLYLRAILHSIEAQCLLRLGKIKPGLAAAKRSASLLRSPDLTESCRNLVWDELGELGEELWGAGQPAEAIEMLRDSVVHLEATGATATAVLYRIKLAAVLRQHGRTSEAFTILQDAAGVSMRPRRNLLSERARVQFAAGCPERAIADCRELLILSRSDSNRGTVEQALAESLMAAAMLESGDAGGAESTAKGALEVLRAWGHWEASVCELTLALARWCRTREWDDAAAAALVRTIQADPLLNPANKAYILVDQAARLDRHNRPETARLWSRAAAAEWRILGLNETPDSVHPAEEE